MLTATIIHSRMRKAAERVLACGVGDNRLLLNTIRAIGIRFVENCTEDDTASERNDLYEINVIRDYGHYVMQFCCPGHAGPGTVGESRVTDVADAERSILS